MPKKGTCKICLLRLVELRTIEAMIKNEGHRVPKRRKFTIRTPTKHHKLSANQICYIMYVVFGTSLERHAIYRHKKHMNP